MERTDCFMVHAVRKLPFARWRFAAVVGPLFAVLWPLAGRAQLTEDFTTDTNLNTTLWTTSSSLLDNLAAKFNSALLPPELSFDASGMAFGGVNGSNELSGIQSVAGFQPPFTVTTTVSASEAHGNAYELFLAASDLSQWLDVAGNLNPGNGSFFGVWYNYDNSGMPFLNLGRDFYTNPSTNASYTIQIFVGADGTAAISLFSTAGAALAVQTGLSVGTGPFYLVLGQREGTPVTAGTNVATWKNAFVTTPAPAPELACGVGPGGTMNLSWSAVVGATYQPQYTDTLSPAQWTNLGAPATATTSVITLTDAPGVNSQRFYRVAVAN